MEQLELLRCKPSIQRPCEPIARGATIDGDLRFDLTRSWGAGPPIAWLMLNPSKGDHRRDDPTVWNIMCRSLQWGFGSLLVVNIYPFITADPSEMKKWRKRQEAIDAMIANAEHAVLAMRRCELVVAAWGAHADPNDVDQMLSLADFEAECGTHPPLALHCLGVTTSGAPKHPLARGKHFVPMDKRPVPFTWDPPEGYV